MPHHSLIQCYNIVDWSIGNKLQWKSDWNQSIFIQENACEIVFCKMAYIHCIWSRPQWVKVLKISKTTKVLDNHDDVIKWKHFPRYWLFLRGIHWSPVNSPHKGQWRGALMLSLICAWINRWVNNREAGDLRRHRAHCDVIVMCWVGIHSEDTDHSTGFINHTFVNINNIDLFLLAVARCPRARSIGNRICMLINSRASLTTNWG